MNSGRASQRALLGVSALLFVASASATVVWGASMSAMEWMAMPGGWTMSMTWMRMPGQSWLAAASSFVAMWTAMMAAMMLPSLVPALCRFRGALGVDARSKAGRFTVLVGLGYFSVWIALGVVVYPVGVVIAAVMMRLPALARVAPLATGVIVFLAGALQLSSWKMGHLACWRDGVSHGCMVAADVRTAWREGVRLGVHCFYGCAALTASLLAVGVMDLRAMAVVTAAVTAERLSPESQPIARVIGAIGLAVGSLLMLNGCALT